MLYYNSHVLKHPTFLTKKLNKKTCYIVVAGSLIKTIN